MSFSQYIKDRWFALFTELFISFLAAAFLSVMGSPAPVTAAVVILYFAGVFLSAGYDFFRKKRYYDELSDTLEQLEEKSYLSEMIEEPEFLDGQILYHVVRTNGKYLNDMIAKQRRELEEYKSYVQTWVHEVKTPIAVERLILENHKGEAAEGLAEEINKVEKYVEQMLYYSKSASVESDYIIRPLSLKKLCMSAVQRNARMMVAEGVSPKFGSLDCEVLADIRWMEFVLGQIITNAVKYRDKERDSWLSFSAEQTDEKEGRGKNRIRLTVEDNGIGIASQDIPRVFAKGFTGENGRLFKKSTGMGLYLCRNLCERMDIEMEIRSVKGEGTAVSFYLKMV